ncbi:MAG: protein TolQ [Myxococcales bacterium]|nr:protein TolQ [Myxococcales bacterium]
MESLFVNLITLANEPAYEFSLVGLLGKASPVVKGVLVLLVLMSLISWYVIVYKFLYLRRAHGESRNFLGMFWASKQLDVIFKNSENFRHSPICQIYRAGYVELTKLKSGASGDTMHGQMGDLENVERALRRAQTEEIIVLESLTPFLATTASAAPFIGLFGTVWGIMVAFIDIAAKQSATLLTVAPGIAEALIATAIGLVAAIPAVIFYNFFVNRMRVIEADMENFGNDFLNIVKRHFFN